MPQISLQYTANVAEHLDSQAFFPALHELLARAARTAIENCKSRAVCLDNYCIGTGEPENAFVHLEVRLFEGRPLELRQEIGRQVLELLANHLAGARAYLALQITVELVDTPRATYFKV